MNNSSTANGYYQNGNGYHHQSDYQQRNRMSVPVPIPEYAQPYPDGTSSTTPIPASNQCPVSKNRRTGSSNGCPVAHGGSTNGNGLPVPSHPHSSRGQSSSGRGMSQSPPDNGTEDISGNDDLTCPFSLPDVSGDKNPSFSEYDNDLLYTNLRERVRYLLRFTNFTEHDVEALNDFQPILLPMVPQLADNAYHHLFKFDVTKKNFMPRKDGQEGRMLSDLHDLALDAPQIQMRKRTFAVYLRKLVTSDYDDFATWQYFDHVGIMHTGQNELKHRKLMGKAPLYVDLMHIALLLAWTLDVLTPVILSYTDYPLSRRIDIMRAFQKVVWIQNDLFTRHYAVRSTEVAGLNQIRQQHDLSSSDDLASLTGSSSFLPTSTVHSSSSGGSHNGPRNAHSFPDPAPVVNEHFSKKHDKKHGGGLSGARGWFGFGGS